MFHQSLYHTLKHYQTLRTHRISVLPIVMLMPHSACNCRCVMCDIWKNNHHLKQLTENDVMALLHVLKKFGTRQVVMTGGEAILHPRFFRLCEILRRTNIKVTLLSTGLTLKKHISQLTAHVHDIIVSLDGDEATHDAIRNIPGAFRLLKESVQAIKSAAPRFRITARSVIQQLNFRVWPDIIRSAQAMGIDQVSFLPADVSSHAFNREVLWSEKRQQEILPATDEIAALHTVIEQLIRDFRNEFQSGYIAESPKKIRKIYQYYAACYGLCAFPYKKCNAPWVSTVIEADGTVRPCFFHAPLGNIHQNKLDDILNSEASIRFRKELDMEMNEICKKCVCYLNLQPGVNPVAERRT